jgi:transposase
MSRRDLTDYEWRVIEPLLPNKPQGVSRVDDRCVLNGIFWVLRSGAPWRDPAKRYGAHAPPVTTASCDGGRRAYGDRLMNAITVVAHDGDIQMIDSSCRVWCKGSECRFDPIDHDDFGSNRSKIMNLIVSNILRNGMRAENRTTLFLIPH